MAENEDSSIEKFYKGYKRKPDYARGYTEAIGHLRRIGVDLKLLTSEDLNKIKALERIVTEKAHELV